MSVWGALYLVALGEHVVVMSDYHAWGMYRQGTKDL